MPFRVGLVDGILKEGLYVGQGTIAGAIGGDSHYGRLHKVVETAEEESQHSTRSHNPNGRVGELVLKDREGIFQTPWLPLAYLLVLALHPSLQVLQSEAH